MNKSAIGLNNNVLPVHCRDLLPKAVFKRAPSDFQVSEQLGFEPDGEGAHLWMQIRKTDCNTVDVIEALARLLGVASKDIGYSGLKDKYAVTTQWLSVPFPINDPLPDFTGSTLAGAGATGSDDNALPPAVEILQLTKSGKKLRRGAHRRNRFTITLREVDADQETVNRNLQNLAATGFPNYFGLQRFGRQGRNVHNARSMFSAKRRKLSRFKRSMYLSAARSYLFNQVLAARVTQGSWLQVLPGEVCMLDGSNSVFTFDSTNEVETSTMQNRHNEFDVHTTGPLFGKGDGLVTDAVQTLESELLQAEDILCNGLVAAGLKAERRALRAIAYDLQWNWLDDKTIELSFALERGVYATSMLSEVADLQQAAQQNVQQTENES